MVESVQELSLRLKRRLHVRTVIWLPWSVSGALEEAAAAQEADELEGLLLVTADRPLCENAVVVVAEDSDDLPAQAILRRSS